MKYLLVVFLFGVALEAAVLVNSNITDIGGELRYDYEIANTGPAAVIAFGLQLPASISAFQSPAGWTGTMVDDGSSVILSWLSSDVSFDLLPDSSLNGFVLLSPDPNGEVIFSALDSDFEEHFGVTLGPVARPTEVSERMPGYVLAIVILLLIQSQRALSKEYSNFGF